jgi:hypothetical protein
MSEILAILALAAAAGLWVVVQRWALRLDPGDPGPTRSCSGCAVGPAPRGNAPETSGPHRFGDRARPGNPHDEDGQPTLRAATSEDGPPTLGDPDLAPACPHRAVCGLAAPPPPRPPGGSGR